MTAANEPEALAVRLIAYVHIIVDVEMFVLERKKKDSACTLFVEDIPLGDDKELLTVWKQPTKGLHGTRHSWILWRQRSEPDAWKNENWMILIWIHCLIKSWRISAVISIIWVSSLNVSVLIMFSVMWCHQQEFKLPFHHCTGPSTTFLFHWNSADFFRLLSGRMRLF